MSLFRPKTQPGKPASKFLHCEFTVAGRRYRGSTYSSDRHQAREFEAKWRRRILDQVHYGILPAMTLGEACVAYFQERVLTRSSLNLKATTRGAKYALNAILRRFGKETSLDRITKEGIAAWKSAMLIDGSKPGTVNRSLAVLIAVMNWAEDQGRLLTVPKVKKVTGEGKRERVLTKEEEERLLNCCDTDLRDFLVFLLDGGARRSEALRLAWSGVDFANEVVRFSATMTKTKEARTVPMTRRIRDLLQRRQNAGHKTPFPWDAETLNHERSGPRLGGIGPQRGGSHQRITPPGVRPPGIVQYPDCQGVSAYIKVGAKKIHLGTFPTETDAIAARRMAGRRYFKDATQPGIVQAFDKALERAGIVDLRLHDLRHAFASRLVSKGVPLYEVSKLLGHSTTRMSERYAHLAPDRLRSAVAVLDDPSAASA